MKTLRIFAVLILGASFAAAQATKPAAPETEDQSPRQSQALKDDLKQITIPPLPRFEPQIPRRVVLPNGMIIFLQENHELPLIGGFARIRGGSVLEPPDKVGMLSVYGDVWRTGGTSKRTGDQLDDFLEARAARVETDASEDSTIISFNCLKGDFEDVFSAFLEVLNDPAFREDKIALAKRQMETGIARRNDEAGDIAGREAVKLAYGPQNPYSLIPEYSTVDNITRADLVAWHKKYTQPQNMIFGITGDFDSTAMEARLKQAFGSMPKGTTVSEPKITFKPAKPGLYFVPKDDVDQSNIQLVALGIERKNPDYFAITVMNEILGGGFASRLFTTLRSKLGLAYSVGGGIGSSWDHLGITDFSMATKSASTSDAITNLQKEVNNLLTNPPTQTEMQRAKDSILNSFVFNFDSKQKVLLEQMRYEFYGYPLNWLEQYRTAIDKVTIDDVNRVAKKYIHTNQLAILVVGNPAELGDQLTKLGPVTTLDISIPPPPGAPAEAGGKAGPNKSGPKK